MTNVFHFVNQGDFMVAKVRCVQDGHCVALQRWTNPILATGRADEACVTKSVVLSLREAGASHSEGPPTSIGFPVEVDPL